MTRIQKLNRYKQDQQDMGGNRQLKLPDALKGLVCEECGGDLGPRPEGGTILGKYQPCSCKGSEVAKAELAIPDTKPFESVAKTLSEKASQLREMPMGIVKANVAKEADTLANKYINSIEASEFTETIRKADAVHKDLVKMKKVLLAPGLALRELCRDIMRAYERQRIELEEAARRERERLAREEAERQRQAEIAHLREQGLKEDAKELAQAPLPPISLPIEKSPAGKLEGVSVIDVWRAEGIENGKAFFTWLAENESCWAGVSLDDGFWKRILSQNHGLLNPPGLRVVKGTEIRHRS